MNIDTYFKPFIWVYQGIILVSIFVYNIFKIIFKVLKVIVFVMIKISIYVYYFFLYVFKGIKLLFSPINNLLVKQREQKLKKIKEVQQKRNEVSNEILIPDKIIVKDNELYPMKTPEEIDEIKSEQLLDKEEAKAELLKEKQQRREYRLAEERRKLEEKMALKLEKEQAKKEARALRKKDNKKAELKAAKLELKKQAQEAKEEKKKAKERIKLAKETEIKESFSDKLKKWWADLYIVQSYKNKQDINRKILMIDFNSEDAVRKEKKVRYKYVARNDDGKIIKDTFDAFSKLDVHSFLLSESYEVYSIEEVKGTIFQYDEISSIKVRPKELVFFLTQLSTYLKAGIPLVDSIKILARQQKKRNRKKLFQSILYELTMGENFSEALMKQGDVYPKLLINMLRTAEMTGRLPDTLDNMSDYYTSVEKTRKQLISALTYPSVILIFALSVVTFILIFVIPEFQEIYLNAGAEIPEITNMIIRFSAFLQKNIAIIVGVVVIIILLIVILYKSIKAFRMPLQWLAMHIPVLGNLIIYNEVTMFTKTFSSLLLHNVFITESMEILTKITNNEIYKMLMLDAITDIARGENISRSFKNHWAFPDTAYQMLTTGERTGQLGQMMEKVADYYQEQQTNMVNQVKAMIEPALIVFLAVVVGGILLAVVVPMFNLYSNLK